MLQITWLGHTSFSLRLPTGEVVLLDPWVDGNPKFPAGYQFDRVDAILLTHGHFDHVGGVRALAKEFAPAIYSNYEIATWLGSKGVANTNGMNKGGTTAVAGGLRATMTHALHSSGITDDDGKMVYGGEAGGYILHVPDGRRAYFAGDTDVFSDMALLRELYAPELAFLPIGDLFTMAPKGAALAAKLVGSKVVIPMHYGTFPPLTGTPAELQGLLGEQAKVWELTPGTTVEW